MAPIIIIGTGMAAYTVARELRKLDKAVPLMFITADDGGFYSKPMLSNAFALNRHAAALVSQSAVQMAEQLGATIMTNTTAQRVDPHTKVVVTENGEYEFSKLVLAVGAQAIRLPLQGDAAHRVLSVNHVSDYAMLRDQIDAVGLNARVTILGAGLIGCEFADDLSTGGHAVTLVDPNALPLSALAPPAISLGLKQALEARGVTLQLGTTAASVDQDGRAIKVTLANGATVQTDVVLSAIGLRPDLRLAQASALTTDRGIVVDVFGRTSAEDIFAVGDCAQYSLADGSSRTLPYIAPIMAVSRVIAKTLLGTPTAIEWKIAPVIVKTPSFSIALIAPPPGQPAGGRWETETTAGVTVCRFYDVNGVKIGFAIAPQDAKLRAALVAEMAG